MKKIFLCALLVSMGFFVIPKTSAETSNLTNTIFKIQGYTYDKLSDMYIVEQYGSAVLIADNILLTNAHVITDSNNGLTLQYEACRTVSEQAVPKCFSTLQLLKYDKNADLALLQIVNPMSDMPNPVEIGSGTLSVGSAVRVVGYPANGGETITTTQGTIAGFQNGYYKTDANIDEGNSGGGTFDNAGKFVGIPTYVINGQTTLGYIIPTDTIMSFIAGEFGTTYKPKYSVVFNKRLQSIYTMQTQGTIDNKLFTTPNFSEVGLNLSYAVEKQNNYLYNYRWYDDSNSSLSIQSLIATDNATITRYITNNIKWLKNNDYTTTKSTKKIGDITRSVVSFSDDDWFGYQYTQTTSSNKAYIDTMILVEKNNSERLKDLVAFVENTSFKKAYQKPEVFNIPVIKLSSKWNIGIIKYITSAGFSLELYPTNGKYVGDVSLYMGEKGDTLKSVTKDVKDIYDGVGYTTTTETSKYPSTASILRMVDDNNNTSLNILGAKKYGSNNIFVHISMDLVSTNNKQEAINLGYKILSLQ